MPTFSGSDHPQAKLTEAIVTELRRRARKANQPVGWIKAEAAKRRVSLSAIVSAIGGQTWLHVKERPVKAFRRHAFKARGAAAGRRYCERCGRPKYARRTCKASFHNIDHRAETSPLNARKAHAANLARGKARREARE